LYDLANSTVIFCLKRQNFEEKFENTRPTNRLGEMDHSGWNNLPLAKPLVDRQHFDQRFLAMVETVG
jgi:hypothetical protein